MSKSSPTKSVLALSPRRDRDREILLTSEKAIERSRTLLRETAAIVRGGTRPPREEP